MMLWLGASIPWADLTLSQSLVPSLPLSSPLELVLLQTGQIWANSLIAPPRQVTQPTTLISESTDLVRGYPATVREVIFCEDKCRVRETVTANEPSRVIFVQPDRSIITNLVGESADGELYMTSTFE
jgi:hypothetical protein